MRGENLLASIYTAPELGSPPLAWGKLAAAPPRHACGGITPTRVGKTNALGGLALIKKDHPHSRGENFVPSIFDVL